MMMMTMMMLCPMNYYFPCHSNNSWTPDNGYSWMWMWRRSGTNSRNTLQYDYSTVHTCQKENKSNLANISFGIELYPKRFVQLIFVHLSHFIESTSSPFYSRV